MIRITKHPVLPEQSIARSVSITVDGREIQAIEGEPVAAALLAAGIRAVRTMPESGEARGVFTGVGRSIEELGIVDGESNVQLMKTSVRAGMIVETQHGLGVWGDES